MSQDASSLDPRDSQPGGHAEDLGLAGKTAKFFIRSPLSILFYIAMLAMGMLALVMTPRQEDPQISVPMVDIMVSYPGASAQQVSNLAMQPLERIMSEIPGVKHVYSASQRGQGVVTVQFKVGEDMGPSLVKVNEKIASHMNKIPDGVMPPLVQTKGIDDVPIVTLTLWSTDTDGDGRPDVDDGQLRLLAQDVLQGLKEIKTTGNAFIVGGRREQISVEVLPERLSGYQISLDQVARTIQTANAETSAGGVESSGSHFTVMTGSFLKGAEEINRLVVGSFNDMPIYVRDVARVTEGPETASQLVEYYSGSAIDETLPISPGWPAVTIAIAKKELTNGVAVADDIISRVEELKGTRIPNNVVVSITRNYGETANDKVSELIGKLFKATGFVFILVLLAFRAFKPAFVVVVVIPVVLLMTIFAAWVTGYTIDRVSLFALIFSIGILVDDAIVVIENIYRRWLEEGRTDEETAVDAVREVGNPTILATFTVIAALLPMAFVSGMMGPYMMPIPVLGSIAMFISLFAAFVFTPYFAIAGPLKPTMGYLAKAEKREHAESEKLERFFRGILVPLIESRTKRILFKLGMWGLFLFTCSFFYFQWVPVKMLPLDNKPEFSVVLDMPEGTALPVTANLARRMAERLRTIPEVTAIQLYAGTARPFDFNGMVRHYYMRAEPWQGELQVQLTHKKKRHRSSHEIAVEARAMLRKLIQGTGARVAVVEMPPGPPVLQSVVAEVHGPTAEGRREMARDLTKVFSAAESTRDVDNYLRDAYDYWRFAVDTEKAVRRGISVDTINGNLAMALGGFQLGDIKKQAGHEPIKIVLEVPLAERSQIERLGDMPISAQNGQVSLPLRELGQFQRVPEEDIIYRKDLRAVEYVVADVGGDLAAPVYGMIQVQKLLADSDYRAPDGLVPEPHWLGAPPSDGVYSWEWAGEWTVTYETFRDMGAAFMVALVLIYILVVWEFSNFRIPLVIMAPIPLTLLGIIPAHGLMFHLGLGGEFTATSMIGWIALAGIIVRNSILLVDFSVHEVQKGVPVAESVIRACKTRTRPILITAFALVAGSSVIFTDPIFQGMAISLASGVLVSTLLTLIVIPLGCVAASKDMCEIAQASAPAGTVVTCEEGAATKAKQRKKESSGPGIGSKILEGVVMVGYVIRGIFLLVIHLVSGLFKKKKPTPKRRAKAKTSPTPPAPAAPAQGGGDSGGTPAGGATGEGPGQPPVAAGASAASQSPSSPASDAPGSSEDEKPKAPTGAEATPEQRSVESGSNASQGTAAVEDDQPRAAASEAGSTGMAGAAEEASALAHQEDREPDPAVEAGQAVADRPSAAGRAIPAKKAAARKKAARKAVAKKAVTKKAVAKKVVAKKTVAKKAPAQEPADSPAAESNTRSARADKTSETAGSAAVIESEAGIKLQTAKAPKKASRRGIRLKTNNGQGTGAD